MMDLYLIHGLSAPRWVMRPLGRMLEKYGYNTHLLHYPSRRMDASQAADYVWKQLASRINPKQPIAIISHSMGGLVMQHLLARYQPQGIHSLIMIAPPNHGVELVSRFEKSFLTKWILYVVGALPSHTFGHQSKPLAPNIGQQYTCHLINGKTNKTISGKFIPGDNDGIVSIQSTHIAHLASEITLPYEHLVLILRQKTAKAIIQCIQSPVKR